VPAQPLQEISYPNYFLQTQIDELKRITAMQQVQLAALNNKVLALESAL